MDVIIQYHEVPKLEWELLFRENDHIKEHPLDIRVFQSHRVMVNF
jgi:hypothetical protein